MSTLSRRLTALAALLAGVPVAVAVLGPGWASAVGLDVWNVPGLKAEVRAEAERGAELAAADDDVRRRIAVKENLVAELIAGRVGLALVAARFLDLNDDRPEYMAAVRENYPGDTDEEKTARNVIEYTAARLAVEAPARQAGVLARLEAEFRDLGSPRPVGTR